METKLLDWFLVPGTAAGFVVGFGACLLAVKKGWISPGAISELRAKVAGLEAKNEALQREVDGLKEIADKWNEMADEALKKVRGE